MTRDQTQTQLPGLAVHVITTEAAAAKPYHKQLSALNSGLGDGDVEINFVCVLFLQMYFENTVLVITFTIWLVLLYLAKQKNNYLDSVHS